MFIKSKSPKNKVSKHNKWNYRMKANRIAPYMIEFNYNSLVSAIVADNNKLVKFMLRENVDVHERGQDTFTPLHVAAYHGRTDSIYYLYKSGADLNAILEGGKMHGFTPVHLAVQKNHLGCVELLLDLGASAIPRTEGIYHPIHYAVFNNFVEVTNKLLYYGADMNIRFNNKFFEENPVTMDPLLYLDHDLPMFHYSILQNHQEMVGALSLCADKNSKTKLGKTALMQAVEVNNIDWVKALATKENVNDRDNFGQPVLHFTIINANRKASMYSKKEHALQNRRLYVIDYLLNRGADVNARFPENDECGGIIHYMIKYGFSKGVKYLLFDNIHFDFNQIDVNIFNSVLLSNDGITPDIKDDGSYIKNLVVELSLSVMFIIYKTMSLKTIGLPVNQNLILKRSIQPWFKQEIFIEIINEYKEELLLQINYMKETKVDDTNITLWELLTCDMNKLVKLMSIKQIRNFDAKDPENKMTKYRVMLKKRLRTARTRKLFLEEMTECIASSVNNLPFDCCQQIASFL